MLASLSDQHPTWALKRFRRLPAAHKHDESRLRQAAMRCRLHAQHLSYDGRVTRVRPTTALLLARTLADPTRGYAIHEITAALYGRPATVRSVRQVVFRANRDFERVGCPLIVHCQSLSVFVQYRPPRFQATPLTPARSLTISRA